jgi:hypothetical protein
MLKKNFDCSTLLLSIVLNSIIETSKTMDVKTVLAASVLLVVPISTSASECTGQCDDASSYTVSDIGEKTKIVTFDYDDGDGEGLETYRTEESVSSACGRLGKTFCKNTE